MKNFVIFLVLLSAAAAVPAQRRSTRSLSNATAAVPAATRTLRAPAQVYPAEGSVFQHFRRHTVLVWDRVPEAASYSLEVDCFHCCRRGEWCTDIGQTWMIRDGLLSNVFDFSFVGAQPGRWRVWSVDAAGSRSEPTPWRTFRFLR